MEHPIIIMIIITTIIIFISVFSVIVFLLAQDIVSDRMLVQ